MHVDRLPRRLFYTFPGQSETEYPTDIPTPPPKIKCEEVQVQVPLTYPRSFALMFASWPSGAIVATANIFSYSYPYICSLYNYPDGQRQEVNFCGTNAIGATATGSRTGATVGYPNTYYMTPSNPLKPRRDLLVGSDRIINPTVDTPCPQWRFTGGNCPPNSLDCGNCCLDCAAVVAGIEGVTAAVLPYSVWRKNR